MKPDIVFFGEDLPQRFHALRSVDFTHCDLLIVMGTSLEVKRGRERERREGEREGGGEGGREGGREGESEGVRRRG